MQELFIKHNRHVYTSESVRNINGNTSLNERMRPNGAQHVKTPHQFFKYIFRLAGYLKGALIDASPFYSAHRTVVQIRCYIYILYIYILYIYIRTRTIDTITIRNRQRLPYYALTSNDVRQTLQV